MQARELTFRLVRLAMAASLLVPSALFGFAAWHSYRSAHELADERLVRSLDVEQEQALKTFELVNLTLANAAELVAGMSEADIRANEERLHQQFKKLDEAVPIVQSIWVYGKDGRPLVTSWMHPPPNQEFPDRDFFKVHVSANIGTYYGQVYPSQFGSQP